MRWPHYLVFPEDVHVSFEAEDLIRRHVFFITFLVQQHLRVTKHRLITPADRRLVVEQIKMHDFFYGVDWDAIRQIEAPFIPELHSVTDTSYFPTEDLDQSPEETPAESSVASKDLPFLGYVNFSSNSLV